MLPVVAVAERVPVMAMGPRSRPAASTMVTLAALLTATAPVNWLALSRVMSLGPPALSVVTPVTVRTPESVMGPVVVVTLRCR